MTDSLKEISSKQKDLKKKLKVSYLIFNNYIFNIFYLGLLYLQGKNRRPNIYLYFKPVSLYAQSLFPQLSLADLLFRCLFLLQLYPH